MALRFPTPFRVFFRVPLPHSFYLLYSFKQKGVDTVNLLFRLSGVHQIVDQLPFSRRFVRGDRRTMIAPIAHQFGGRRIAHHIVTGIGDDDEFLDRWGSLVIVSEPPNSYAASYRHPGWKNGDKREADRIGHPSSLHPTSGKHWARYSTNWPRASAAQPGTAARPMLGEIMITRSTSARFCPHQAAKPPPMEKPSTVTCDASPWAISRLRRAVVSRSAGES